MVITNFLGVGLEASYSVFLTTYAVKSPLNLSEVQGSQLTAFHTGSFAAAKYTVVLICKHSK